MTLDADVQRELNSATGGFYAPTKSLAVGASEEITVLRYAKHTQTKYPIKDKEGKSLGYTWRFWLANGKVWDVSNQNRKVLIQGLHPNGGDQVVPGVFMVINHGDRGTKAPAVEVKYKGQAGQNQGGTHLEDQPF